MIQSIQKPLSLLIGFAALSLAGVPSVAAINNDSVAAPAFTDSLDTTLRPCTQLRCEIGGGFDRALPGGDSGAGGGWANQQETIRLSGSLPIENSGSGGGWANQQETIRLSASQPGGNSGGGGGWIQ